MNVLVQVSFKIRQSLVKGPIADAGVRWQSVIAAGMSHRAQGVTGCVVFVFHHGDRVSYRAERGRRTHFPLDHRLLHSYYVGEEYHFFLHHVRSQFLGQAVKAGLYLQQFGMVLAVDGADFVEQRTEAGDLRACVE